MKNLNRKFLFHFICLFFSTHVLVAAPIQENTWKVSGYKKHVHGLIQKEDKFEFVLDRKKDLEIPTKGTNLKCILSQIEDSMFLKCGELQMDFDCQDRNGFETRMSFQLALTKEIDYYVNIQCTLGKASTGKGK